MARFSMVRIVSVLIPVLLVMFSCKSENSDAGKSVIRCQRIVSTAPSITETLFEMGLGDRVVGVSDNCSFPDAALKIRNIGKVLDISMEAILLQKPDTVIFTEHHSSNASGIKRHGVESVVVDHSSIKGFLASLDLISEFCGTAPVSGKYMDVLKQMIKTRDSGSRYLKVMTVVGREYLERGIKDVYIAGDDGFYSEILSLFEGVQNVYSGNIAYPKIQTEGILSLDPDIIIDVVTVPGMGEAELMKIRDDWKIFKGLKAVVADRVFVVNRDYWSIPGPRFIKITDDMEDILNSESGRIIR